MDFHYNSHVSAMPFSFIAKTKTERMVDELLLRVSIRNTTFEIASFNSSGSCLKTLYIRFGDFGTLLIC
jgi:hypothetical protein